jgi:hypothetical protein
MSNKDVDFEAEGIDSSFCFFGPKKLFENPKSEVNGLDNLLFDGCGGGGGNDVILVKSNCE